MSIETDLEAFLPGALNTLLGSTFKVEANDIYFDAMTRRQRSFTEILCTYAGEVTISQETGDYILTTIDLELMKATYDAVQGIEDQQRIERLISDAAKAIVKKYHGVPEEFMVPGSLNVLVDSVRCQRDGEVIWRAGDESLGKGRAFATTTVRLELLTYEEP